MRLCCLLFLLPLTAVSDLLSGGRDRGYSIVCAYAPFVFQATDEEEGRQDLIANIDFDGDLVGNNNWEHFGDFPLIPTVYYAFLETATHYFIAFHLFHPRDWNHVTFWLHDTHENDGENFQIVVRKSDGAVVLLWTQAHYRSEVYVLPGAGIGSGRTAVDGVFQVLDANGKPDVNGEHVAVFVESEGHGIYGTLSQSSGVTILPQGQWSFDDGSGVRFRPAHDDERIAEPSTFRGGDVPYRLVSTTKLLWPLLRDGTLTGDGRLLDGVFPYKDSRVRIDVPGYYDADRYSGPFGPDRGISPFALDFFFDEGTLGALFFNPAERYLQRLTIQGAWSTQYLDFPFVTEKQ